MSVQPQSSTPSPAKAQSDLDTTAELPVLDVAAYEAVAEPHTGSTDAWIVPAPGIPASPEPAASSNTNAGFAVPPDAVVGEDQRTQLEVSLHALSDDLREVEEHPKRKGARVGELQRKLEEREATNRGWRARAKELEEKLALRDKALARVQQDLTTAHALAATYLESLRSVEGRRGIFEDLSTSLYWEVDARDTRLAVVEERLSAATSRAKDLEAALAERTAHAAKLEKEVENLNAASTQREQTLRQATLTGDDLKASVRALTDSLAARDERVRALEAAAARQSAVLAESSRTAQSRSEELEAANTVQRKRVEQLEAELAAVRAELQQRAAALQEASAERNEHMGRIAAAETQVEELQRHTLEEQELVRLLQAECNAGIARVKELEGDLRAAEDMINRLEADLRGRNTRLDELEKTNQQWRATVEEARNALVDRDSLIRRLEEETNGAVLLGAIQQRLDATGAHEIAPEGDRRLLIRPEGDSEVVHVLGRKTSVGRTPDNDLQIDTKYISRHHAVILAGPIHTIIEDLNSTNGVLVNGRRVTRHTLKDGDAVMIGKTMFRFAVRPVSERRV
jgi:chromosome segregation ATPase